MAGLQYTVEAIWSSTPGRTNPRLTRRFCSQTRHIVSLDYGASSEPPSSSSVPARNCLRPAFLAKAARGTVSSHLGPDPPPGGPRLGAIPGGILQRVPVAGDTGLGCPETITPHSAGRVRNAGFETSAGLGASAAARGVWCQSTAARHPVGMSRQIPRTNPAAPPPQPRGATSHPLQIHLEAGCHLWRIRCGGRRWGGSPCLAHLKPCHT